MGILIPKKKCYPEFLIRLENGTDKCFKLIRNGRNMIEVEKFS